MCVVFSFHRGAIQTSLAELGIPVKILFKIKMNKYKIEVEKLALWLIIVRFHICGKFQLLFEYHKLKFMQKQQGHFRPS